MAQLIHLAEHPAGRRRRAPPVCFTRSELQQLLSLYSRRVAAGDWRDYAIDCRRERAVFAIFRHSQEAPLFTVSKRSEGFAVHQGARKLKESPSLAEAVSVLERQLTLVKR